MTLPSVKSDLDGRILPHNGALYRLAAMYNNLIIKYSKYCTGDVIKELSK